MFPLWQTFSCIFVSHVSSSKVPACLRHSTARQATIFTEAALYREGVPYQRQAFLTTIQTELKVFGTLPCGGYFYWTLFMTDLYHLNDLKKKKKSKYKSRYSEAFLNAVHDPPVTSINSTRRTIRLLNLLLSCDRPLVCSEVTGFLWLWAWSYDSSEVDGSNWKHRTALYEKDLGQVGLFSLFMYFFSFSSPTPPPPNTAKPRSSN